MNTSYDTNGNKVLKVPGIRSMRLKGFSIQTLGNLPKTHIQGVCKETWQEVVTHIFNCGTPHQRGVIKAHRDFKGF